MMRVRYLVLFISSLLFRGCENGSREVAEAENDPVELVNVLMGTDSDFSLSNGNTYPAIATPWGMNFWTPQTNKMGTVIAGIIQVVFPQTSITISWLFLMKNSKIFRSGMAVY